MDIAIKPNICKVDIRPIENLLLATLMKHFYHLSLNVVWVRGQSGGLGNELADEFAKLAARQQRVDDRIRKEIDAAIEHAQETARWLALATMEANAFLLDDGRKVRDAERMSECQRRRRNAGDIRRRRSSQQLVAQTCAPTGLPH